MTDNQNPFKKRKKLIQLINGIKKGKTDLFEIYNDWPVKTFYLSHHFLLRGYVLDSDYKPISPKEFLDILGSWPRVKLCKWDWPLKNQLRHLTISMCFSEYDFLLDIFSSIDTRELLIKWQNNITDWRKEAAREDAILNNHEDEEEDEYDCLDPDYDWREPEDRDLKITVYHEDPVTGEIIIHDDAYYEREKAKQKAEEMGEIYKPDPPKSDPEILAPIPEPPPPIHSPTTTPEIPQRRETEIIPKPEPMPIPDEPPPRKIDYNETGNPNIRPRGPRQVWEIAEAMRQAGVGHKW